MMAEWVGVDKSGDDVDGMMMVMVVKMNWVDNPHHKVAV